jgi:hypothetical protein
MTPSHMTRRARVLITAALLIPILVYAIAGVYSRFMADDFCYAVNGRDLGFPAFIPYYYHNWFGRITQIIGTVVTTSLGTGFGQIFPALVLLVWGLALWWLCRELAMLLRLENRLLPLLAAALLLYATLAGTPQIFHSLYWLSGVFPYTIPLVAATFIAAVVLRVLRTGIASLLAVLATVLLVLVAGFASEPFSVALVGALALSILGVFGFRPSAQRAALILLIIGQITALVALGIMVAAPGNTLRQGLFTPTHDLVRLASQSFVYAAASLVALVWVSPPALPLALLIPAIIAYSQPATEIARRRLRIWIMLPLVVAFGLIVLINVPAIYATSLPPPARVLIIPQFVLVCAFAVIGYSAGLYVKKSSRRPPRVLAGLAVVLLIATGPLLSAAQMIGLMPKLSTYATEWDQREQRIIAAVEQGETQLVVEPLSVDVASLTGLDRINTDASAFTNACAASYYGLESLVASS